MRRPKAAVGSAAFFLVGPGIVVGLIPWLLTGWKVRDPVPYWAPLRVLGVMPLAAGLLVLIQAFVRSVVEGFGTPAPIAAPERLSARSTSVPRSHLADRRGFRPLV